MTEREIDEVRKDLAMHDAGYAWGTKSENVAALLADRDRLTRALEAARAEADRLQSYRETWERTRTSWEKENERLRARTLSDDEVFVLRAAVENLRGGSEPERRVEAAFRIAAKLEAAANRIGASEQSAAAYDQPMRCRWCDEVHRGGPENCGKPEARPAHPQS